MIILMTIGSPESAEVSNTEDNKFKCTHKL